MDRPPTTQNQRLQLIECPRDAMQGWPRQIPAGDKIRYLNALLRTGFHTLDFGSFVSAKTIPQLADTSQVLQGLDLSESQTRLLAIVANVRGAEEAVGYESIGYLGFPFSLSPSFQQRNTNSTLEESRQRVESILELCVKSNKELVIYLSMGFGNPYGDPYNDEVLLYWADEMSRIGIRILSLADTVGLATPQQVRFALETLIPRYPSITVGVHLHAGMQDRKEKIDVALLAGCTRIDSALKGIGGCPMAQDELVGNMDTEFVISTCEEHGFDTSIDKNALAESLRIATEIFV